MSYMSDNRQITKKSTSSDDSPGKGDDSLYCRMASPFRRYMAPILVSSIFLFPFCLSADVSAERIRNFISISPENPYFPFVLLFGFILLLATFYKPKFGLIVMLFFIMVSTDMPVEKTQSSAGRSATIRFEDIILMLVSGGWLLNRAKTRTLGVIKNVPVYKGIMIMSFAMLLASLIGYLQGTVKLNNGILFTIKRLEYFWIFFMTLNIMDSYKEVRIAVKTLICVSVAVAAIGVVQFFLFPVSELVGGGATATAGFGRANTLADFFLIAVGLTMGLFIYLKDARSSFYCLIAFSIFLFAIIMTKSRGAYVSLPPIFFIAYLFSKSKKILLMFFFFLLLGGMYYATTLIDDYRAEILVEKHQNDIKNQFTSIGNVVTEGAESDSSFYARYTAWKDITPEIMAYPFFGHGVGSMTLGFLDNQYVHELYDTGIVGLFSLLYMNLVIFFTVLRFFRRTKDDLSRGLSLGFMAAQIGMLVHGITLTNFYTILNMEAFWFILALIMILYYNENTKDLKEGSEPITNE